MRILYATDGSRGALTGAEFIGRLRLDSSDEILVLSVATGSTTSDAERAVELGVAALRGARAQVSTAVLRGTPEREILRVAHERSADLLAVGSSGRSSIGKLFRGSVVDPVVREAEFPVLQTRPLRADLHNVIIGVDESISSWDAAKWVSRLPFPEGCKIHVVTALPLFEVGLRGALDPTVTVAQSTMQAPQQAISEAQQRLERLAAELQTNGVTVHPHVIKDREGVTGLLDAADTLHADLIVVGSHHLGLLERLLDDSTSEGVRQSAPCSVLVVPEKGDRH